MAKNKSRFQRLARLGENIEAETALRREIKCGSVSGGQLLIGDEESARKLHEWSELIPVHQIPAQDDRLDAHAVNVGVIDGKNFVHGHEFAAELEIAAQNARKVSAR